VVGSAVERPEDFWFGHGRFPIKFTTRTAAVTPSQMIRVDYVEGSFTGEGVWKFEPLEKGRTRLSYRWQTSPA